MSIEELDALVIEVLDRMRNAVDQLQLDKAKALANFHNAMRYAWLAGEMGEQQESFRKHD